MQIYSLNASQWFIFCVSKTVNSLFWNDSVLFLPYSSITEKDCWFGYVLSPESVWEEGNSMIDPSSLESLKGNTSSPRPSLIATSS